VITKTLWLLAVSAGETAVIVVAATVKQVAATKPKTTLVAPVKPVPVMVTVEPPAVGPDVGEMEVTVGVGMLLGVVMRPIELLRFVNHRAPSDPDVIR